MANQIAILFARDDNKGIGCLEYSWVPEGVRHTIRIHNGEAVVVQNDSLPDDLRPLNVQVHRLSNDNEISTAMWQFPALSEGLNIVHAAVEISVESHQCVGIVYYGNGSKASYTHQLDPYPRPCPEPQNDAALDKV
jgi:hypothetical protein